MLTKEKPVQGYVIYAEFRNGGNTRQIFFTPDGYTSGGQFVPMKAFYRTVSSSMPRKQWKTTITQSGHIVDRLERGEVVREFGDEWAHGRLSVMHRTLDMLAAQEWEMIGPPLIVEASKADMDDVSGVKTPTKILYRINQSRLAAGYPADLF